MGKGTVAKNLKRLLNLRRITQTDMARELDLKESTVSSWVNGTKYPRRDKIEMLADFFGVRPSDITDEKTDQSNLRTIPVHEIPVVSQISAGMPIYSEQNIVDHTYIASTLVKDGREYFGLVVEGDSMDKEFREGDIVVVEKSNCIENGQIGVVMVNGYNATLKRVKYINDSILLMPESNNSVHEPQIYDKNDELTMVGRVIGLNRRY
ncbi:LexA family protein [Salinicoccus roseus]|uniref:Transcriptional regulator n=1 Tax=Salinicoccus roseus TaxID=45670 RepID=A0A265E6K8_9STAP|nr:XRE family transcriptional regulator [Salinicoccus roseus]OZT77150.1 transcriptional regulator [Salinicoccus roseus]